MCGAFYAHGALCQVALSGWRFVPRGAFRVALSGPPYVALSEQKAPHRAAGEWTSQNARYSYSTRGRMPRSELCTTQQVRLRPTSGRSPGDQGCTRARRVSDGAPSGGALCSSGLNLLAELELVHLRIVGGALASEACERGDRGGAKARSRRSRSRVGGSELGRRGWWRGHRSVRRAACALLHQCRIGRPAVTAGGRIPPPIAPTRPSRRHPSRDDRWRQGGDTASVICRI